MVYSSINLSADIKTGYSFQAYHYLKDRVALSLLLLSDIIYYDTNCIVILCDSSFFGLRNLIYQFGKWLHLLHFED